MVMVTEERPAGPIDDDATGRALRLAVRHLNAPLAHPVSTEKALAWLSTGAWSPAEEPLARALLDETDLCILLDVVLSGAVGYSHLANQADRLLAPSHPTRIWLDERRHG